MPDRVETTTLDYPVLVAGLLRCVRAEADGSPLDALTNLVDTLTAALGALAGSFVEYQATRGRVIVTSGGYRWAVGRPVDRLHPAVQRALSHDCVDMDIAREWPPELAGHLIGMGWRRAAVARADLPGDGVGTLHLYFPDPRGTLTAPQRDALMIGARLAAARFAETMPPEDGDGPLVAGLADGLAIVGPDQLVRSWNPAARELTGVPSAEAVGRAIPFEIPAPGQVGEHQLGNGRWIQVLCSPLADSADRVVTFRDITEARDRAQARDLFVAATSHELRTPVTVVRGYAETLDRRWDQLDEPARREAVRAIRHRAERLGTLVDRLLIGGSEEKLDTLLALAPFDLAGALRSAAERLPAGLTDRLELDLDGDLPQAVGDAGSVPTVLTELVQNAHKYSPDGGPITVTATADRRTVYFQVADRGIGVHDEDVERVFQRFWQAEDTDRRRFGGVGLGLYLVRKLVERQNGWVSLRPRNPGGTVVEVRLPRADVVSGEA